jgi:hypothetical protein
VKWLARPLKALGYTVAATVIALLLFQPLSLAVVLIHAWISDPTDWHLEDYMCTVPQGCSEFIAERKRQREQNSPLPKSN